MRNSAIEEKRSCLILKEEEDEEPMRGWKNSQAKEKTADLTSLLSYLSACYFHWAWSFSFS